MLDGRRRKLVCVRLPWCGAVNQASSGGKKRPRSRDLAQSRQIPSSWEVGTSVVDRQNLGGSKAGAGDRGGGRSKEWASSAPLGSVVLAAVPWRLVLDALPWLVSEGPNPCGAWRGPLWLGRWVGSRVQGGRPGPCQLRTKCSGKAGFPVCPPPFARVARRATTTAVGKLALKRYRKINSPQQQPRSLRCLHSTWQFHGSQMLER